MKIRIGLRPTDVRLMDDDGRDLGVKVVSFKLDLDAQQIPIANIRVELWGDTEHEIIVDGVSLDREGVVLYRERTGGDNADLHPDA